MLSGMARTDDEDPWADADDDAVPCPIYDAQTGRQCGKPTERGTLTCKEHDTRSSSTQISRLDAARRRYGV